MGLLTKTVAAAALVAGVGLMAAPAAQAVPQTVSYNIVFSAGQAPGLTSTDYFFTAGFQQWDSSLFPAGSTLTGVYIEVTGNAGGSVDFFDSSPPNGGGTLVGGGANPTKAGVQISVATPDSGVVIPVPTTVLATSQVVASGSVAGGIGSYTLAINGTDTKSYNVPGANLGIYEGSTVLTTTGGVCGGSPTANSACSFVVTNTTGNIASSPHLTAEELGIITYTYDDGTTLSPEPASMAMLGAGLFGLAALRRRRRG
jgi:hypothetical protein